MKQREFQKCVVCGEGMAHNGDVHFYRVKVEQFILDPRAIRRQAGLEQVVGNAALAATLGPDEDLARGMGEHAALVCARCTLRAPLAVLAVVLEGRSAVSDHG